MKEVFKNSIGKIPYDGSLPLNGVTTGVVEEDDLTIEKVIFCLKSETIIFSPLFVLIAIVTS